MTDDQVRLCGERGTGAPCRACLEPGRSNMLCGQLTCFQKGKICEVVLVLFFYPQAEISKIPTQSLDVGLAVHYGENLSKFLFQISG